MGFSVFRFFTFSTLARAQWIESGQVFDHIIALTCKRALGKSQPTRLAGCWVEAIWMKNAKFRFFPAKSCGSLTLSKRTTSMQRCKGVSFQPGASFWLSVLMLSVGQGKVHQSVGDSVESWNCSGRQRKESKSQVGHQSKESGSGTCSTYDVLPLMSFASPASIWTPWNSNILFWKFHLSGIITSAHAHLREACLMHGLSQTANRSSM